MSYDHSNIFAQIINGTLPCNKIYEDDQVIAFHDIKKAANLHILILPKGEYISFDDFCANADSATISHFFKTVRQIAKDHGISDTGYRIVANHGADGMQTVPHFHLHLLGKEKLGGFGSAGSESHK